jgi:hypothetical protein
MSPSRLSLAALLVLTPLALAPSAWATRYQILPVSQQQGPSKALAGASVNASAHTRGAAGNGETSAPTQSSGSEGTSSSPTPSPANPTLPSNSPRLANPHPGGPGSFWYTTVNGEHCIYEAASDGVCFNVVEPAGAAEPPINPAAIAASAASRIALEAGTLQTSPSSRTAGLTGAASWFWLEPSPAARALTVGVRGERVTVTASAKEVLWSFGEGTQSAGGAGVPYRPGPAPAGAVRHVYQTRCLPGDQGHDPSVLASCGANGYTVSVEVVWSITYQAGGPVAGSGALPARTTTATISYPVSESRAFLTASGGGA